MLCRNNAQGVNVLTKTYVIDTNVLIQAPHALLSFEDNRIVLPIAVLEELDKAKTEDGETGANARQTIRFLENLRLSGNLLEGVPLPTGGLLRLETNCVSISLPHGFKDGQNDNRILKVCKNLLEDDAPVILVTKDIMVRIKAQMLGVPAEDFTTDQAPRLTEQYSGRLDAYVPDQKLNELKKKGIAPEDLFIMDLSGDKRGVTPEYNQFFILRSDLSDTKTMLGRYDGKAVVPLTYINKQPFGIKPKNVGQVFLQEALMQPADTAPLVIIRGTAGTAKTFYSLAVGLHKILENENHEYRKILVTRPNVQFDDDIGFLPGSEQEKIAPMLRPVIDNLELLVDKSDSERYHDEMELQGKIDELFDRGIIQAEAMNFIRGRSITQTYLMIDEAQNLTPRQVKGIITRVGRGTKVILLGDPQQIDHPLLDERTNGLSYASEKMKGSPLCFQIMMRMDECERSLLAADAAKRM